MILLRPIVLPHSDLLFYLCSCSHDITRVSSPIKGYYHLRQTSVAWSSEHINFSQRQGVFRVYLALYICMAAFPFNEANSMYIRYVVREALCMKTLT